MTIDQIQLAPGEYVVITTAKRWTVYERQGSYILGVKKTDSQNVAMATYEKILDNHDKWLVDNQNVLTFRENTKPLESESEIKKKITKQRKKQEKKEQARANGKPCGCGCGGKTGGGRYLPGHDAKHKSQLVKSAISGNSESERTLELLGWTSFLTKARDVASKPKKTTTHRERIKKNEDQAVENIKKLNNMKAAAKILKNEGRYFKDEDGYVEITSSNATLILEGKL